MSDSELIGLNVIELQAKMIAPSEPASVSMWPETQGWIWLAVLCSLIVLIAGIKWFKYRKATAYRRAAILELKKVGDDAMAIADIIRRVALVSYPRELVVSLHGENWLAFLDQTRGKTGFNSLIGKSMNRAPYTQNPQSLSGLNKLAIDWVSHHKLEVTK